MSHLRYLQYFQVCRIAFEFFSEAFSSIRNGNNTKQAITYHEIETELRIKAKRINSKLNQFSARGVVVNASHALALDLVARCSAPRMFIGDPKPVELRYVLRRISYLAYSATERSLMTSNLLSTIVSPQRRDSGKLSEGHVSIEVRSLMSDRSDTEHSAGSLLMPSPKTRSNSQDSTTLASLGDNSASVANSE
jgi:hypothetical protein